MSPDTAKAQIKVDQQVGRLGRIAITNAGLAIKR